MSWSEYVDEDLMLELPKAKDSPPRFLTCAAIVGLDGGVWAGSEAFPELSDEEFSALKEGFDSPDVLQSKGLHLDGKKYIPIQGVPGTVVRGKGLELKATGFTARKCDTCIVIGFYGDGVQPGECNKRVEDLGDYLENEGY